MARLPELLQAILAQADGIVLCMVFVEGEQCFGQFRYVFDWHQQAVVGSDDGLGAAAACGDDGQTLRQCFDIDDAEGLGTAGKDECVAVAHEIQGLVGG